jgi:hypothetical protein
MEVTPGQPTKFTINRFRPKLAEPYAAMWRRKHSEYIGVFQIPAIPHSAFHIGMTLNV